MQLRLPERMKFQLTPGQMEFDALMNRLYNVRQFRAPYFPKSPYGLSGLGCNPGETKNNPGGGQSICNDDGSTWSPYTAPVVTPPQYEAVPATPVQPVNEACQPWDSACVARNTEAQTGYQVAEGEALEPTYYNQCLANGTDQATCAARWPAGYSGNVPFTNLTPAQQTGAMQTPAQAAAAIAASNAAAAANLVTAQAAALAQQQQAQQQSAPVVKPNQSVPPTTPLTPMSTGFQNTGQVISGQLLNYQTPDLTSTLMAPSTPTTTTAASSNTLLIVAAVGIGLLLLMGGKS